MRKVLSFVLVLALVLGSFSMAFADSHMFSDMTGESSAEAVSVLKDLGVVAGYPDGTFRPDQIVTRAEMARLVIAALGLDAYAVGTISKYPDMVNAAWAQGYVAYATSIGFISGYPDGTFKPNQPVSYQEACSMLVRALGYTEAFLPGGWPSEWIIKAKSLGILDDITAGMATGAVRGDIAKMIYNALTLPIGQVNSDNVWLAFNSGTATDPVYDTMLDRLGAGLANDGEAFVVVDQDSVINLKPFLGAYVTAYVNSDDEIIAIKEVKSTYLEGEFDTSMAIGQVFEADKDYDIRDIVSTAAIKYFKNGKLSDKATVYDADTTETFKIAAKVSGVKIDDIYSVSIWDVTYADYFEDTDAEDIADDQKLFTYNFDLDDNDDIDMSSFELVGAASLDAIPEDAVVYVYVGGTTPKITKIEVGTKVVTGELTRISAGKYTVDGVAYEYADNDYVVKAGIAVKDEVKFYLDYAGNIFESEIVKGEADKLAIVLDNADGTSGLNGTTPKTELFLADGTSKVFVADADAIDDVNIITDSTTKVWQTAATPGAVIKYSVDSDGVIDGMTVSAIASVIGGGTLYDISSTGYMDGFKIASDAVIFTIDSFATFSDDADDYGVTTTSKILGLKDVKAKYATKDGMINLIVMESSATAADEVYGVYDSAKATTAADPGYEVRLLIDGSAVWHGTNLTTYTNVVTSAGLYLVVFDTNGDVKELKTNLGTAGTDYNLIMYSSGVSITITNNVAAIDADVYAESGDYDAAVSVSLASNVVVYKLNADSKWVKGSTSDIKMTNADKTVQFFDVSGDDKVADIVLIWDGDLITP
jgi:hypothetical protein